MIKENKSAPEETLTLEEVDSILGSTLDNQEAISSPEISETISDTSSEVSEVIADTQIPENQAQEVAQPAPRVSAKDRTISRLQELPDEKLQKMLLEKKSTEANRLQSTLNKSQDPNDSNESLASLRAVSQEIREIREGQIMLTREQLIDNLAA